MNPELQEYLTQETRDMLNFIFDGVYIVDKKRTIHFWSKGAERITGYAPEEVIGKSCRDDILNHLDENGKLLCIRDCPLVRAIESDQNIEEKVYPMHKDGHRFPVSTHIGPIKTKEGKIIGAIEVFRDISAEEKLQRMDLKFKKLIRQYVSDATYDSVWNTVSENTSLTASTKDLTVLFIDIVKFTTLSETHAPEKVVDVLNLFFSLSSHIIRQHTGDIDKFIGDCSMAIFIDAQDAVNAAKEIVQKGLPDLNKMLILKGLPQINLRIGINSGRLVQGNIGSEERKDMTVIGDVVNTASRVQGEASPGNFLITESTLSRLDNLHEFVFAKEIILKGKSLPIKLYEYKFN